MQNMQNKNTNFLISCESWIFEFYYLNSLSLLNKLVFSFLIYVSNMVMCVSWYWSVFYLDCGIGILWDTREKFLLNSIDLIGPDNEMSRIPSCRLCWGILNKSPAGSCSATQLPSYLETAPITRNGPCLNLHSLVQTELYRLCNGSLWRILVLDG